jgi:hypothetical protein
MVGAAFIVNFQGQTYHQTERLQFGLSERSDAPSLLHDGPLLFGSL